MINNDPVLETSTLILNIRKSVGARSYAKESARSNMIASKVSLATAETLVRDGTMSGLD